ncbi:hypothetical protein ACVWYG_000418 [Pedobacter sp. UYEF25]
MRDFLSNYDLYKVYQLDDEYCSDNSHYTNPFDFIGETFNYYCSNEEAFKTFELDIDEPNKKHLGGMRGDIIPNECFVNEKLDFTFRAIGRCKSCNNHNVNFLLHVFSNNPIANIKSNIKNISFEPRNNYDFPDTKIFIQKIGCYPEVKIIIDREISKHFDRETNIWYYEAKTALKNNYGIGSFAYFRRVIEKELIKIIEEIKLLPDAQSIGIQNLLDQYNSNPKTHVIYDNIFQYLPNSLKQLGENPIKLLYNQTSDGLHALSEETCLERAKSISTLLEFTIKKINEEKSTLNDVKQAIKNLK